MSDSELHGSWWFVKCICSSRRQIMTSKVDPRTKRIKLEKEFPVLANTHLILTYDVPVTEDVGLLTKFRFNVGPALQPIAGSMPGNRLRHWPSTNLSRVCSILVIQPILFQCWLTVFDAGLSLKQHWVIDCCIMLVTTLTTNIIVFFFFWLLF